jgi:hypothetical protein
MSVNNKYFNVKSAGVTPSDPAWVRNPNWLPLDDVQPGDNKFSGLWAVYEDVPSTHWFDYQLAGAGPGTVDYGDGNVQVTGNLINYQHYYDYTILPGPILNDPILGNYKMVVININFTSNTTGAFLDRNGTPAQGYAIKNTGWLDVIMDCSTMTTLNISTQKRSMFLERLRILNNNITNPNAIFQYLYRLRVFDWNIEGVNVGNFQSTFQQSLGDIRNSSNEGISLINNTTSQFSATFASSFGIKKIGTISSTSANNLVSTFSTMVSLIEVDKVLLPNVTSTSAAFNNCPRLERINEIDVQGSTNTTSMFTSCLSLSKIGDDNDLYLPNSTAANNMFLDNFKLKHIKIYIPNLLNASGMFNRCYYIENIDFYGQPINITTMTSMFGDCRSLKKINLSGTTITGLANSTFSNCNVIEEIILGDCSAITNTGSMFANCWMLEKLRVPGIRISFVINGTSIEAPEMVTVFNDLADLIALGLPSQNINIQSTPASVQLTVGERAIALDKGWTITG